MFVAPVLALAAIDIPDIPVDPNAPIQKGEDVISFFEKVLNWVGIAFWIFAVGFILYAGFLYLTAGGDTNKITLAAGQFKYGVIAIVIGLLAYGLPKIISNILSEL